MGTRFFSEIRSVDLTGDTVAVKAESDYLGSRYTDYLTLLCHDGRWVIVNKVFYQHAGA